MKITPEPNEALIAWERETDYIAHLFADYYFDDPTYVQWVDGEIGDMLVVNDYFFDLRDIVAFLRYDYSREQIFKYYDYRLDERSAGRIPINIENWIKII